MEDEKEVILTPEMEEELTNGKEEGDVSWLTQN